MVEWNIEEDIRNRFKKICKSMEDNESREHLSDFVVFMILNRYRTDMSSSIVTAAEHDIIYLMDGLDCLDGITDREIEDLILGGVRCGEYGLEMFV